MEALLNPKEAYLKDRSYSYDLETGECIDVKTEPVLILSKPAKIKRILLGVGEKTHEYVLVQHKGRLFMVLNDFFVSGEEMTRTRLGMPVIVDYLDVFIHEMPTQS